MSITSLERVQPGMFDSIECVEGQVTIILGSDSGLNEQKTAGSVVILGTCEQLELQV